MKYPAILCEEVEKFSEWLVGKKYSEEEIELFYEFCYGLILRAKDYDECINFDLTREFLKDDLNKIYLAFYKLVYG